MKLHHAWAEGNLSVATEATPNALPASDGDELQLEGAQTLLLQGKLEEAEQILTALARSNPSPASLDLLARVYVRKGRLSEARSLWEAVLNNDSGNASARNALRLLSSPWRLVAAARRFALLVFIAIATTMCGLGALTLTRVSRHSQEKAPSIPSVRAMAEHGTLHVASEPVLPTSLPSEYGSVRQATIPPAPDVALPVPEHAPFTPEPAPEKPLQPVIPNLVVPGCTITTNASELVVTFNEGLFRYRCELTETGSAVLDSLATGLATCPPVARLLVEGHTDNDPMPQGGPFPSNYALGFARAATVADRLKGYSVIPAQTILASSMGSENPPFSNEDYDSRLRNRTVVLRIAFAGTQRDR